MPLDRGGYGETHLLLQLASDAVRVEEEGGSSNGIGGDRIGETGLALLPEGGKKKRRGTWCVPAHCGARSGGG